MEWARILAYITGTVDHELLLRNEYLAAENRVLRGQLKGRLKFSDVSKVLPVPRNAYARHDRILAGKPMLNCQLSGFRIEGSPSFILTEISPVPSRPSIPSSCRRSVRCRPPRRREYGGRRHPDDSAVHRAYKASVERSRY